MRILLDECVPRLVKRQLPHLSIATVREKGWAGIKNGELLRRAAGELDVLVTSDKRLRCRQNLRGTGLAVVVLPTNRVPDLVPILPRLDAVLHSAKPGDVIEMAPA